MNRSCVHCFELWGQRLVVDGNSGSVHVVDQAAYELVKAMQQATHVQANAALAEVQELISEGVLFSPAPAVPERTQYHLKALCMNVAHDCNLRCKYCFANAGDFGGQRELMSVETARQGVDFLLQSSGERKQLEIDFFGGEPLLNMEAIRAAVTYGNAAATKLGKSIRYTLTTNGLALTPEICEFINETMDNVVLSLDGRPRVNDRTRQTLNCKQSVYKLVVPKFQELLRNRSKSYYVRGTFTRKNLDFAQDAQHLSELGFRHISIEPVIAQDGEYAIGAEDVHRILQEYEALARVYAQKPRMFSFFHFHLDLDDSPCIYKRLTGCGAGYEYLALTPDGSLYPCHQFVGQPQYQVGSLLNGITNLEVPQQLLKANVLNKPACQSCWAKFFCSGGCHASNLLFNNDVLQPYEITCKLMRKRIECALALQAEGCDLDERADTRSGV